MCVSGGNSLLVFFTFGSSYQFFLGLSKRYMYALSICTNPATTHIYLLAITYLLSVLVFSSLCSSSFTPPSVSSGAIFHSVSSLLPSSCFITFLRRVLSLFERIRLCLLTRFVISFIEI